MTGTRSVGPSYPGTTWPGPTSAGRSRYPIGNSIRPALTFADDIFVLDLTTGEQRRITEAPANRYGLGISGHRLAWSDTRNELEEEYYNFDVYAYDLETDQEIPVAVRRGSQRSPVIYGDTVVWADNRNNPQLDAPDSDEIHSAAAIARRTASTFTPTTSAPARRAR